MKEQHVTLHNPPKWTAEIKVIAPQEAQRLLDEQETNRPIKDRQVLRMVETARSFGFPPTMIVKNASGRLIDGQHRMAMVVSLGQAMPFVVLTGADEHDRWHIDLGGKRSPAQEAQMRGIPDSRTMQAVARALARVAFLPTASSWPEIEKQLLEFEPQIKAVLGVKNVSRVRASVLTAFILAHKIHPECVEMLEQVSDGMLPEPLLTVPPRSPAGHLTRAMLRTDPGGGDTSTIFMFALGVSAIGKHYMTGDEGFSALRIHDGRHFFKCICEANGIRPRDIFAQIKQRRLGRRND